MAWREWKRCGMGLWVRYTSPQDYAKILVTTQTYEKKSQPVMVGIWGIGGDGGNRTRVRKSSASQFYMRSLSMVSPIALRQTGRLWVEPALI